MVLTEEGRLSAILKAKPKRAKKWERRRFVGESLGQCDGAEGEKKRVRGNKESCGESLGFCQHLEPGTVDARWKAGYWPGHGDCDRW